MEYPATPLPLITGYLNIVHPYHLNYSKLRYMYPHSWESAIKPHFRGKNIRETNAPNPFSEKMETRMSCCPSYIQMGDCGSP